MHSRVRYSQDHARAQNLKKPEHETGRKSARKLRKLTMISKMCTYFFQNRLDVISIQTGWDRAGIVSSGSGGSGKAARMGCVACAALLDPGKAHGPATVAATLSDTS